MSEMTFSGLCPDEDCPPEAAIPASAVYYRLLQTGELQPDAFRSYKEEGKTGDRPCLRCGVSVYRHKPTAQKQLDNQKRNRSHVWENGRIAEGGLMPRHGVVAATFGGCAYRPNSRNKQKHHTWWFEGSLTPADRAGLFKLVQDD